MSSARRFVHVVDDSGNRSKLVWAPDATLGGYINGNPSFCVPNQDPVFYCEAQDKYMHRECTLDESLIQPEEANVNIRVKDNVEINVELYNNENCKGVVILNNGSDTFDNIKEECERALLLSSDMPIVGWKVDSEDVDANEKVFDRIMSSCHTIVAVIELLKVC
ncbi:hypothetical protein GGH96_003299 [Coemansia sp. RSA 1972]|nr:hypothetical protein GGH96_003299 [Coemansia sp. RSA 1972]